MEIIKSLEEADLLRKGVSETIENEAKEQKYGFPGMLWGTLCASLLERLLTGKELKRSKITEKGVIKGDEAVIRAGHNFKCRPILLKYINIIKANLNLMALFSRYNLLKIRIGAYVKNLDLCKSVETYLIALYVNGDHVTYFNIFEVEHIPKEIKTFIGNKNVKANIYRAQANDLIICVYFCIGFISFMLKSKSLLD